MQPPIEVKIKKDHLILFWKIHKNYYKSIEELHASGTKKKGEMENKDLK